MEYIMNLGKKVISFAKALTSRGLSNKKTERFTKQLRVISCFGDGAISGDLPPCEHLRESKTDGKFFCGGCGCGDRKGTWLISDSDEYSKLDYPSLSCPLKMPGFSDYEISSAEESIEPITRRYYIETLDESHIENMPVSEHEIPEDVLRAIDKAKEKARKKIKDKTENDWAINTPGGTHGHS